jgi:tetratricopeptide (TPR) repeat protein
MNRRGWFAALGLAGSVFVFYWPTTRHGFVWDDFPLVVGSRILERGEAVRRMFTEDMYVVATPGARKSGYYRPIAYLSFFANARLLGPTPGSLHVVNAALHALAAALLFALLAQRFGPARGGSLAVAVLAAAWWALHPCQVEAVAWVSARYELLVGIAVVSMLLLQERAGAGWLMAQAAVFALGLLCKEITVAVLPVLALDDLVQRRSPRLVTARLVVLGAVMTAVMAVRHLLQVPTPRPRLGSDRLIDLMSASFIQLKRAVAPLPLDIAHTYRPSPGWQIALAGLILCLWVAAAFRWRRAMLSVAIFTIFTLPPALFLRITGLMAERYFYLPSIGFALLLAFLGTRAARVPRGRLVLLSPVAGLLLLGAWAAHARLADWQDDERLFSASLENDASNHTDWTNLGLVRERQGDLPGAVASLEQALKIAPGSSTVAVVLSRMYARVGDGPGAVRMAQSALAREPGWPEAFYNLAIGLHLIGNHKAEAAAQARAVRLSPTYILARIGFGRALCEIGWISEGKRELQPLEAQDFMRQGVEEALLDCELYAGAAPAARERFELLRKQYPESARLPEFSRRLEALAHPAPAAP